MTAILDEIKKLLPDASKISDTVFEGANIILYTKDKDFFLNNNGAIKDVVNSIKKRVELRPDPAIAMEIEKAEDIIKKTVPEEAAVSNVIFDSQRSRVIIESEKPGLAIGKQGEVLREIRAKTLWVPIVRRTPSIRSKLIENIRGVLYEHSDYRRKFLNKVGHRIYDGWLRGKKHEWVRLTYLGSGRQVGRSCMLLQTPESRVLLDCGINVAAQNSDAYPMLDAPEFKIEELDAIVLSHAHVDHSAFIPYLFKMGYRGPVYCTAPTRDISALLALDYIGVAFKQAKKGLYTATDVKEMVKHTICLDYEEVTDITPDVRLTFYNAGHIIGACVTHLHIGNGLHNLVYSGDIKCIKTKLLDPAKFTFPRLETLMLESTYGGRDNILTSRREEEEKLIATAAEVVKNKGKILLPVLGVGRAQDVMLILEEGMRTGKIPKVPIYVQGMVWDVTAIHTAYPDYLSKSVRRLIFHKDENPFLSEIFKKVGSRKEQKDIIESAEPCIILATSGMLTAGASVEYFRALHDNPKNALVFSAYQGEGSLGRRIQNGERDFTYIFDDKPEQVSVKLSVHTFHALSGHAGRNELLRYVHNLNPKPRKIIVNHGESSRCLDLASTLHKAHRIETNAPKNLETIRLK
jgi:uncharacterized protein